MFEFPGRGATPCHESHRATTAGTRTGGGPTQAPGLRFRQRPLSSGNLGKYVETRGGGTSSVFFLGVAKDKVPSQVHHPPCQVCPRTG
jgi:hypothetical protein